MTTPRTVGDWLAGRWPAPPDPLRARITAALGANAARAVAETESVCLEAAERVLARLVGVSFAGRRDAPDLLAADALVTYALEFVAQEPAMFGDRATSAIHRLGKLSSVPA